MPDLTAGDPLPLMWHWVYLLERPATADLGPDGHPLRGAVPAPPGPGMRRMWAGGRVVHLEGLRAGIPATRRTSMAGSVEKRGRSGPMTVVTVRHQISQNGQVALEEEQDIVYREAAPATPVGSVAAGREDADADAAPVSRTDGDWEVATPPTLLFRFSALTYNAHRIHYDRDYARDVEGYPGLVVHGPLQAVLMAEAVRRQHPVARHGTRFSYRLVAPVFDHEGLVVSTSPPVRTSPGVHGAPGGTGVPTPDVQTGVRSGRGLLSATGTYQPAGDLP